MNNLRLLRNQKGISQQKLADLLNLSQQSIYKYENGLAEPDIQTLKELSELFDVSIDYIVGNTDDPRRMDVFVETELAPRELRCLRMYRRLTATRKKIIEMILEDYDGDCPGSGHDEEKNADVNQNDTETQRPPS